MANTRLIEDYIRSSGYKLQFVAQVMGISTNALHQKLLGRSQFKLDEAETLSVMLGMTMLERDACFFDHTEHLPRSIRPGMAQRKEIYDKGTAKKGAV